METQSPEEEGRQLCTSCAAPNDPSADFCVKCGAPISWFSKIGPFESIFAQGFIWREAAGRPRRLIVVLGIWLLFLPQAVTGLTIVFESDALWPLLGWGLFLISAAIVMKTTWNYLKEKSNAPGADQTNPESDARAV